MGLRSDIPRRLKGSEHFPEPPPVGEGRKTMKSQVTRVLLVAALLAAWGCSAGPVESVSLDFPHGELRLLVRRNGETHLFYGALPASYTVVENTFDLDELLAQLQTRLYKTVPVEEWAAGRPYGMVTIHFSDGSSREYLIYDEEYATALFAEACNNRLPAGDSSSAVLDRMCETID